MPRAKAGLVDGIQSLGGGRWRMRIQVFGKPVDRVFRSRAEAVDTRDELRRRDRAMRLGLAPPQSSVVLTVSDILDDYVDKCVTQGRSPRHVRSIEVARGYIVAWAGEHRPAILTSDDLFAFAKWMRANTKSQGRSIHNALVILCTAMRKAGLQVPPKPNINLPSREPKTLPRGKFLDLLAVLPIGSLARTALEMGVLTGARMAELSRIRVKDVDLERGTIVLRRKSGPKGNRESQETIPITSLLRPHLEAYIATRGKRTGEDFFLAKPDGGQLGESTLKKTLMRACSMVGADRKTSIGFTRAQATTMLREASVTLKDASLYAGHKDEAVTRNHYDESQRSKQELWDAHIRMAERLGRVLVRDEEQE